jgi:tetratricopeptide (TPR) repeat protein
MFALVSGEAAVAVCIRGDSASVFRVDSAVEEGGFPIWAVNQLLLGASDILTLQEPSIATIRRSLATEWALDRVVRLILMALDPQETEQDLAESIDCLESLLSPELVQPLLQRLCNAPLPSNSDLVRLLELCANGLAAGVVTELGRLQPRIREVAAAWDSLPLSLFDDELAKSRFRKAASSAQLFAQLARPRERGRENEAIVDAYRLLATQKNYRAVVAAWANAIGLAPTRGTKEKEWRDDYEDETRETADSDFRTSHEQFVNVMEQQNAIEELLRKGEEGRARDYAAELVSTQIARNDQRRAAKSLCRLAQLAKLRGLHSLSLEWNERATQIAPEDGWAHIQNADAYLYYGRLDEAQREFNVAKNLGQRFIADCGHIRILRARTRYDEALGAVAEAKRDYAEEDEAFVLWHHEAETLRDMWRLEEALAVYEDAVKRFFDQRSLYCGKAAVLVQLGRPADAIDVYTTCIDMLGADVVPLSGRAQAMLQMGRIDDAIDQYKAAIEKFPDESGPRCGLAEVLHLRGNQEEALNAYKETRKDFPFVAVPFSGYAEVLKDIGEYERALEEYNAAIKRFPYDPHLANGRVSVLKLMGRFEEALAAADEATAKFPFDLLAMTGRAVLLRVLSRLDEATEVYDNIISRWPGFLAARHGKASVLVVQKRYNEALQLLPSGWPKTVDEWIAHHIRGMVLLRTGRINEAKQLFEEAVARVPYYESRKYFRSALAILRLRQRDYEDALTDAQQSSSRTISNVLVLHALLRLDRRPEAIRVHSQLANRPLPPVVGQLKEELAGQLGLVSSGSRHDDQWLFENECEAVLLAA